MKHGEPKTKSLIPAYWAVMYIRGRGDDSELQYRLMGTLREFLPKYLLTRGNADFAIEFSHALAYTPPIALGSLTQLSQLPIAAQIRMRAMQPRLGPEGTIEYFESLDRARARNYTSCKAGRFLKKVLPEADSDTVRAFAECFELPPVTFGYIESDDVEGWLRVYRDGPDSCMKGHPSVGAYALPNNGLRLAYMARKRDGAILARAIVYEPRRDRWRAMRTKGFVSIYPRPDGKERAMHAQGLRQHLLAEGYKPRTRWYHLRLAQYSAYPDTERPDTIWLPYLDGKFTQVVPDKDSLCVDSTLSINSHTANKCVARLATCPDCGEKTFHIREHTLKTKAVVQVCSRCWDYNYRWTPDGYERRSNDQAQPTAAHATSASAGADPEPIF